MGQVSPAAQASLVKRNATEALKRGYLHPDRWAEIDDLLLDGRPQDAAEHLRHSLAGEPVHLGIYGGEPRRFPYGGQDTATDSAGAPPGPEAADAQVAPRRIV